MADKAMYSLLIDLKADTAQLQRDMDKAVGLLQKSGRLMNNVITGIGQGLGQAFGKEIISSVGKLSTALTDLADKGDKVSGIIDNFQKLGGSSTALKQAQHAVLGTVSAFDLMRAANEGLIKRIPNLNQNFAQLAEFANRFADATGGETVPVLNELIAAIASGNEKALKPFGFQLQDNATKAQNTATAIGQLGTVMGQLAPLGDSVTASYESFNRALSDASTNIGIGINDSEALAAVYREMAAAIDEIDWKEVGAGIASIAASIASVLPSLKTMTGFVNDLASALEVMANKTAFAQAANKFAELRELNKKVEAQQRTVDNPSFLEKYATPAGANQRVLDRIKRERDQAEKEYLELEKLVLAERNRPNKPEGPPKRPPGSGNSGGGGGGGSTGDAQRAARELEQTQAQFRSFLEKDVRTSLSTAVANLDQASFDALKEKLRTSLEQSFIESNKQFVDAKLMTMDELTAKAKEMAKAEVDEYSDRMAKAYDERASREKQLAEEQKRAAEEVARIHQQAVNSWRGFWDRLFSGDAIDYKQSLKELATGFASELSAGLFGELKNGGGTFFALGQLIATGFGDGLGKMSGSGSGGTSSSYAQMVNSVGNYFGSSGSYQGTMTTEQAHSQGIQGPGMADGSFGSSGSMTTEQAHSAGVQGPGGADGNFDSGSGGASSGGTNYAGYMQAGGTVISAAANAKKIDKANRDNSGTGGAVGAGLGAVIGAYFGPMGSAMGAQIGQVAGTVIGGFLKRGPQNKETIARHTFANWMEDFLSKQRFVISDQNNSRMTRLTNFVEGSNKRFNDPNWGEEMQKQSKEVQSAFSGLGVALKEILGITEDVGKQMGFLLGKNLNWNVNNARHLFKQMGLSVQEIEDKLVEAGRQGKMSWLEVESAIQGVHEASKPGLIETGAYDMAFGNILKSGGRGFEAIQSVRDLGVELKEAGVKTFEEMQKLLMQKGFDEKSVNALIEALKQRGVMSPEDLANVTDRIAGGIVADMQARGASFADLSKEVTDAMESVLGPLGDATQSMRELTTAIRENTDKSAKMASTGNDAGIPALAAGGVVFGPKRGLMGENGPEAILPLTRRNGKMGVSLNSVGGGGGGYVVNIDARGAGAGVEGRIRSAMREAEDRAVRRMMRNLNYASGRTN